MYNLRNILLVFQKAHLRRDVYLLNTWQLMGGLTCSRVGTDQQNISGSVECSTSYFKLQQGLDLSTLL